jgi:hypothetical protein
MHRGTFARGVPDGSCLRDALQIDQPAEGYGLLVPLIRTLPMANAVALVLAGPLLTLCALGPPVMRPSPA